MSDLEFDQLLLGTAGFLRPFAITLTHDYDAARDLLQETFYRALANKEKYNLGTNIKAWLFTIMRNIFINNYRRNRNQPITLHAEDDLLLNHHVTVANTVESNIIVKEVENAIYHLPEIFRTPFIMHVEGYKYYEISKALKEPLGTIKSRIHFARKVLKQKIEMN